MSKVNPELVDNENPEWSDEMFAKAKRGTTASKMGRPKSDITKQAVSIRLSPEVVDYFKQSGKGWQTRVNEVLEKYVSEHK